ncbi:MAG: hypothetical protein DWQ34_13780 [Planctomycetota bacterium]|nr:MAG: hypothetical protein DWQ29_20175 [Planctomycetota bacterium]REJ91977.1 MAG: hypothetical protein DWQ34_13780 [Planctomycetota bacterium]REK27236.1 MAG: hypothetical protein DWQ41_07635 [Planctomycetota bacterium]REK36742.1 MAG: hypothetical protein DWQ45_09000 [Planctomycetota bacterium]
MTRSHQIRFEGSRFWVVHRRREYGPFDYEWSSDLYGVELTYRGCKFGEFCSEAEIFADLSEFKLPMRVVQVASLVCGCQLYGMLNGLSDVQRERMLSERLHEHGCSRFASE